MPSPETPETRETDVPEWVVSMTCGMLMGLLDRRQIEPRIGGLEYHALAVSPPGQIVLEVLWPAEPQRTHARRWLLSIDVRAQQ